MSTFFFKFRLCFIGNKTSGRPIPSVIIQVISPNWTPLSPITIINWFSLSLEFLD